jgi:hypothetical protein
MKRLRPILALVAFLGGTALAPAAEFSRTFSLREPLGLSWPDELVHHDEKIEQPRVAAATFALADADGKPVPLQVEVLEGKPDAVRRVRLWLRPALEPNREAFFRLTFNSDGRKAPAAADGLVVRRGEDRILVLNGLFEVALPAPQIPFIKSVELRKAPAPLGGIRPAGDKAFHGAWALEGGGRVKELRADLAAAGPLWAEIRLKYIFEDRAQAYDVALKFFHNEPWIDVTEKYRLPAGNRLTLSLHSPRQPAEVLWMPWFQERGGRPQPAYDVHRFALGDPSAHAAGAPGRPDAPLAVLWPKFTQARRATQVFLATGLGESGSAVGVVAAAPSEWAKPYEQLPTVRALAEREGVAIDFPLADGRRRWALVAGRTARFDSKAELQHLLRRHADVPLDRLLNDWILPRASDAAAPRADLPLRLYVERSYQDAALAVPDWPLRVMDALRGTGESSGRPASVPWAALAGYVFSDPNYVPGPAGGWEMTQPDFYRQVCTVALAAAAMMPDHPHAKRWATPAATLAKDELKRTVLPSGAGAECPAAAAATLASLLPLMDSVARAGGEDLRQGPEVRAALDWLRLLHTPLDPRLGRRVLAPLGDTPHGQEPDGTPAPSPPWPKDADWSSRAWTGFGAVLRSRFGTDRETFATFKCGPARAGYDGDELAFHFFGAAMPVALDWHCPAAWRTGQEHIHNRCNLGENENLDAAGELLAFASTGAGDAAVGQVRSTTLRKMPRYPYEESPPGERPRRETAFPRRTLAAEARYRRFLLLVKHDGESRLEDYLVIRDEFTAADPATFNLFILARSVRRDGQTFRFDGQLAADAVAYFAAPDADKVQLDRWAWPRQDESSLIPRDFRIGQDPWRTGELQEWLRVTASPGAPFLAVLYAYRKGAGEPKFEALASGRGVRVTLGKESEEVYLATDAPAEVGGQAVLRRGEKTTVILKPGAVPPL